MGNSSNIYKKYNFDYSQVSSKTISSEYTDIIDYKVRVKYNKAQIIFYDITKKIRNTEQLNDKELQFINSLSNEDKLNIIKLYNYCICNLRDIIERIT